MAQRSHRIAPIQCLFLCRGRAAHRNEEKIQRDILKTGKNTTHHVHKWYTILKVARKQKRKKVLQTSVVRKSNTVLLHFVTHIQTQHTRVCVRLLVSEVLVENSVRVSHILEPPVNAHVSKLPLAT